MILSLGILGFLMNYIVYKKTDKTLMKYFSKEEVDVIKETMYEDGQQVIIDDYTITLERICYDRTGRKGKLMFSVIRDGYNMLEEYTSPSELWQDLYLEKMEGLNSSLISGKVEQ